MYNNLMVRPHFGILILVLAINGGISGCSDESLGSRKQKPQPKPNAKIAQALPEGTVPHSHIYGDLIGNRVVLDGIAWDQAKGLTGRVVLPSGREVFIRQSNGTVVHLPNGKLIRAIGILTYEHIPGPHAPLAQGVPGGFWCFRLDLESFEIVESAEREFPEKLDRQTNQ